MATFSHTITDLGGITAPTLADEQALAALTIAAAGAIGLITRTGPQGIAIGLLGHGGHIILHARPSGGACLVDVLTPGATSPQRAVEVIARRLGVTAPAP